MHAGGWESVCLTAHFLGADKSGQERTGKDFQAGTIQVHGRERRGRGETTAVQAGALPRGLPAPLGSGGSPGQRGSLAHPLTGPEGSVIWPRLPSLGHRSRCWGRAHAGRWHHPRSVQVSLPYSVLGASAGVVITVRLSLPSNPERLRSSEEVHGGCRQHPSGTARQESQ